MHKWYQEAGEQNDVVISTRVRLARSLPGYPYPKRDECRRTAAGGADDL